MYIYIIRRSFILWLFLMFLACNDVADSRKDYGKWLGKNENEIIEKITILTDKDINLGAVILEFCKGYYPEIDTKKYLHIIDKMSKDLKVQLSNEDEPEEIIQKINHYLYIEKGFKMGSKTIDESRKNEDTESFLNKVLDNKMGNCFGLTALYLAITERLNIPIYGVLSYHHVFIRYDNGKYQRNIEPGLNGDKYSDEIYLELLKNQSEDRVKKEDIEYAGYFNNITKKEFISSFLKLRGKVHYLKGKTGKANDDWQKAAIISSKPAEVYYWVGGLLAMSDSINNKDYNLALFYLNKAGELTPNYYTIYAITGYIYHNKKKFNNAIASYSRAIELNQKFTPLYYERGRVYLDTKEYDKAIKDFDKVIGLDSKFIMAYYSRGSAYKDKGSKKEAIMDFKKVIELSTNPQLTETAKLYLQELKKE